MVKSFVSIIYFVSEHFDAPDLNFNETTQLFVAANPSITWH